MPRKRSNRSSRRLKRRSPNKTSKKTSKKRIRASSPPPRRARTYRGSSPTYEQETLLTLLKERRLYTAIDYIGGQISAAIQPGFEDGVRRREKEKYENRERMYDQYAVHTPPNVLLNMAWVGTFLHKLFFGQKENIMTQMILLASFVRKTDNTTYSKNNDIADRLKTLIQSMNFLFDGRGKEYDHYKYIVEHIACIERLLENSPINLQQRPWSRSSRSFTPKEVRKSRNLTLPPEIADAPILKKPEVEKHTGITITGTTISIPAIDNLHLA